VSPPLSPRNAAEAIAFLRAERNQNNSNWYRLCLKLTRVARGLPGGWATANIAMYDTPRQYRVYNRADLRRGMVVYFDDPHDANTAGHICTFAGRRNGVEYVWSNDALRAGKVDLVPFDYFPKKWGDPFVFGATWLNGHLLTNMRGKPYKRDR
jgi:hypothetical protein